MSPVAATRANTETPNSEPAAQVEEPIEWGGYDYMSLAIAVRPAMIDVQTNCTA
jgi:hypothetical protein